MGKAVSLLPRVDKSEMYHDDRRNWVTSRHRGDWYHLSGWRFDPVGLYTENCRHVIRMCFMCEQRLDPSVRRRMRVLLALAGTAMGADKA